MKLGEIKEAQEDLYDVIVASKLGRHPDKRELPYKEAKQELNNVVGDYQSDIFPEDPLATIEWKNGGNAAVIKQHTGNQIFFYLMRSDRL